jgi:SAM-dependent methyltransferase
VTEDLQTTPEQHWEEFYNEREHVWSGNPNVALVREITGVAPGTALDLGCGEGADAIWLASNGWRVTAIDVSATALDRGAAHAKDAGVADRIDWQRHDLGESLPGGEFDLVSMHYLHSPVEFLPYGEMLRRAATLVAPGGTLLVVGHGALAPWNHEHDHHNDVYLPTPDEVLADLALPPEEWQVERAEEFDRGQAGPDGEKVTRHDTVVRVSRRPNRR